MLNVSFLGGGTVDGSKVEPGERIFALAVLGNVDIDFASAPPPPEVDVFILSLMGGATVRVRRDQAVNLTGLGILGERKVEPAQGVSEDAFGFPLKIAAYCLMGGVSVKRSP